LARLAILPDTGQAGRNIIACQFVLKRSLDAMLTDILRNLAIELSCGPGSSKRPDSHPTIPEKDLKAILLSTQQNLDDYADIDEVVEIFNHFFGPNGMEKFRKMNLSSLGNLDDLL
jgi:hypothetical protein